MRAPLGIAVGAALLLFGCGGSQSPGTVTGHLYAGGGPNPGARPLHGSVVAAGSGSRYVVAVGSDGRYRLTLPPGGYTVTGHSPLYFGGNRPCAAEGTITIASGQTSRANVFCQER